MQIEPIIKGLTWEHPLHQSTLSRLISSVDYTAPGGGVWVKTCAGTAYHQITEALRTGEYDLSFVTPETCREILDAVIADEQQHRLVVTFKNPEKENDSVLVEARHAELAQQTHDMVHVAHRRFLALNLEVIACEVAFRLEDPVTGARYSGEIDTLARSRLNGQLVIVDEKTNAKPPTEPWCQTSPQHHLYCLAVMHGELTKQHRYHEGEHRLDWAMVPDDGWFNFRGQWPPFLYCWAPDALKGDDAPLFYPAPMAPAALPDTAEAQAWAYIRGLTALYWKSCELEQREALVSSSEASVIEATASRPRGGGRSYPMSILSRARPAREHTQSAWKILLYGQNGTGKTYAAAGAPKPFVILTGETQGVPIVKARNPDAVVLVLDTFADVVAAIKEIEEQIAAGTFPYESVVIDGLTELQRLLGDTIPENPSNKFEKFDRLLHGMTAVMRRLRLLRRHVICTALDEVKIDANGRANHKPDLVGKIHQSIGQYFNVVGLCHIHREEPAEDGERPSVEYRARVGPAPRTITKGHWALADSETTEVDDWIARLSAYEHEHDSGDGNSRDMAADAARDREEVAAIKDGFRERGFDGKAAGEWMRRTLGLNGSPAPKVKELTSEQRALVLAALAEDAAPAPATAATT